MRINYALLEDMYAKKRGALSDGKVFYPKKPRTCRDCFFEDYDYHRMRSRGCTIFNSENGKPKGICIPVRFKSSRSKIHADNVRNWITNNLIDIEV